MDLRLLKRLVFDSIRYAGLNESDKSRCQTLLQIQWEVFTQLVASLKNSDSSNTID